MPPITPTVFYNPKAVLAALSQQEKPMIRDGEDRPSEDGKYKVRRYIIESMKEGQDVQAFAPATEDLPETHEHFVRHYHEARNGRDLMMVEIGVRPKATRSVVDSMGLEPQPVTSDGLATADEATLRVEAAKAGVDEAKLPGMKHNDKVKAIREGRKRRAALVKAHG